MELDFATLENALLLLGQRLSYAKKCYEVVAIGGASLVLLGFIDRATKDLDLVAVKRDGYLTTAKPLPPDLVREIAAVGAALEIGENWVNAGPASLLESGLPEGFEERLNVRKYESLTIYFAGRLDQICFKLYAAVDQGPKSKHFADLKQLKPSQEELLFAKRWCLTQDVSLEFSILLQQALSMLEISDDIRV
jgi:uncharacterized nucleotidyltransferase DUF6036